MQIGPLPPWPQNAAPSLSGRTCTFLEIDVESTNNGTLGKVFIRLFKLVVPRKGETMEWGQQLQLSAGTTAGYVGLFILFHSLDHNIPGP